MKVKLVSFDNNLLSKNAYHHYQLQIITVMKNAKQYYIWMYLPDSLKLPKYLRDKDRRREICESILQSIKKGEAKLFQSGLGSPNGTVKKTFAEGNPCLFTNVILKFSTHRNID